MSAHQCHCRVKYIRHHYAFLCRKMCIEKYGVAPEVKVAGHTATVFPYIMSPLEYILHEILKNSMRSCIVYEIMKSRHLQTLQTVACRCCFVGKTCVAAAEQLLHAHIHDHYPYKGQRCQVVTFCHPGLIYIFNFLHSGTLVLGAECQSA